MSDVPDLANNAKVEKQTFAVEQASEGHEALIGQLMESPKKFTREEAIKDVNQALQSNFERTVKELADQGITLTPEQLKAGKETVRLQQDLQTAILKGDATKLQELVKGLDPKQLEKLAASVEKNLQKHGAGLTLDVDDKGQLILFTKGSNQALLVSKEKIDVIGFNSDGSYNYGARFPGENAARTAEGLASQAFFNMYDWRHPVIHYRSGYKEGASMMKAQDSMSSSISRAAHAAGGGSLDMTDPYPNKHK